MEDVAATSGQTKKPRKRRTYTVAFEEFWTAYPLKADKGNAADAYPRAIKRLEESGVENPQAFIVDRAKAYAASDIGRGDKHYIKFGEGWLNGDRFLDDPATWTRGQQSAPQAARSFRK